MSFYVHFANGTRGLVEAASEFDAWALPGVIACFILGGQ
jgi:hypothetical protein